MRPRGGTLLDFRFGRRMGCGWEISSDFGLSRARLRGHLRIRFRAILQFYLRVRLRDKESLIFRGTTESDEGKSEAFVEF